MDRLTPRQKSVLKRGNLHDTGLDIILNSSQEIARKCKVSAAEAQGIIDSLYMHAYPPYLTRLEDVVSKGNETCTTGYSELDNALGGGIRPRMVWEVVGESAAGKTQFALQLSLFAQLPSEQKGLCGATCYITTSSILPTSRLVQMMQMNPSLSESDCDLKNIHTLSTPTIPHLIHVLSERLPHFILAQAKKLGFKPVKVLIIDALGELFHTSNKTTTTTLVDRSKNIAQISALLHTLAQQHSIAVLVLNEVVDAFDRDNVPSFGGQDLLYREQSRWFSSARSVSGESRKQASLGLVWTNQVNARILLSRTGRRRYLDEIDSTSAKRFRSESSFVRSPTLTSGHTSPGGPILIRRLSIIFSSVSRPSSLDYVVTEAGMVVVPGDVIGSNGHVESPSPEIGFIKEEVHTTPCSLLSPLDIGTAEEGENAAEEASRSNLDEEPQDEWDHYWASNEIPDELYDKVDLDTSLGSS